MNMARKKEEEPTETPRPGCPNCGYPHAKPPKCRACGTDIKGETVEEAATEDVEETPTVEEVESEAE